MHPTARDVAEAPVLESERLRLRPLIKADLPAVLVLAGDRQVAEQTARIPHPLTLAAAEVWLKSATAGTNGPKEMLFAIEHKEDGAFLGAVGLEVGAEQEPAELGFWLGRPYWNRGYMTEAVRRLLRHALQQRGVQAVRACVFPGNVASVRVQEKVGMRLVGRDIQRAPARGCCGRESEVRELRREDWCP